MHLSFDDRAIHPSFDGYLLSVDKDMEFPVVLPFFLNWLEVSDCTCFDPIVFLPMSMD